MAKKNTFFYRAAKVILFGLTFVIILSGLYLYRLPAIIISKTILIKTNSNSLNRFLNDSVKLSDWWVNYKKTNAETLIDLIDFKHYYLDNLVSLQLKIDDQLVASEMRIVPAGKDSSYIKWQFTPAPAKNTVKKIQQIFRAGQLEREVHQILGNLKNYTEKSENIYGFKVEKAMVKDTLIATCKYILKDSPTTTFIYEQVDQLKLYLKQQQAEENNFPMLSIQKTDNGFFEIMVGLPVNRVVTDNKIFLVQRMVAGDILWLQCKGGPYTIKKSFIEMENYMQDYGKSSPAIPFQKLITDRRKEQDTLNWITKIYFPVNY